MKISPNQPTSELVIYAGIFLKTWTVADAGTMVPQHAHVYPHVSLLVSGIIRAWRDDELLGDFHAPATIKIPARAKHRFLSLTDGVVIACVHAADEAEVADEHVLELEG